VRARARERDKDTRETDGDRDKDREGERQRGTERARTRARERTCVRVCLSRVFSLLAREGLSFFEKMNTHIEYPYRIHEYYDTFYMNTMRQYSKTRVLEYSYRTCT